MMSPPPMSRHEPRKTNGTAGPAPARRAGPHRRSSRRGAGGLPTRRIPAPGRRGNRAPADGADRRRAPATGIRPVYRTALQPVRAVLGPPYCGQSVEIWRRCASNRSDDQRDRERQVRPQLAASVRHGAALRTCHRGDLRRRRGRRIDGIQRIGCMGTPWTLLHPWPWRC